MVIVVVVYSSSVLSLIVLDWYDVLGVLMILLCDISMVVRELCTLWKDYYWWLSIRIDSNDDDSNDSNDDDSHALTNIGDLDQGG